jgi:hypothetical protein
MSFSYYQVYLVAWQERDVNFRFRWHYDAHLLSPVANAMMTPETIMGKKHRQAYSPKQHNLWPTVLGEAVLKKDFR